MLSMGISCASSTPTISDNSILNYEKGIYLFASSPDILNNLIQNSEILHSFYGIICNNSSSPLIKNNTIDTFITPIYCLDTCAAQIIGNHIKNTSFGIYLLGESPDASPFISGNLIENNGSAIICNAGNSPNIVDNIIINNAVGISIHSGQPIIRYNSIYNNNQYNIQIHEYDNPDTVTIDALYNWWGTTNLTEIEQGIYDNADEPNLAHLNYQSFLDGPGGNVVTGDIKIQNVSAAPCSSTRLLANKAPYLTP